MVNRENNDISTLDKLGCQMVKRESSARLNLLKKEEILQKLSKQLIEMLLKPRKNVKQMIKEYEENIILPPLQFTEDYKPNKP